MEIELEAERRIAEMKENLIRKQVMLEKLQIDEEIYGISQLGSEIGSGRRDDLDTVDTRQIYDNYIVEEDTEVIVEETDTESVSSSCTTKEKTREDIKTAQLQIVQTIMIRNVITRSSGNDSDDNLADKEDEGSTPNLPSVSRGNNMVSEKEDGLLEYKVAHNIVIKKEKAMQKEEIKMIGLDAEIEEALEKILQESKKSIGQLNRFDFKNNLKRATFPHKYEVRQLRNLNGKTDSGKSQEKGRLKGSAAVKAYHRGKRIHLKEDSLSNEYFQPNQSDGGNESSRVSKFKSRITKQNSSHDKVSDAYDAIPVSYDKSEFSDIENDFKGKRKKSSVVVVKKIKGTLGRRADKKKVVRDHLIVEEKQEPVRKNNVVLVVDDFSSRNVWLKGIVVAVFPGKDGHVRVAVV